jgi:tripartite-type tricarboxylate transporter receptor subunit TctC
MPDRRRFLIAGALAAGGLLAPRAAAAETYPARLIRLIVPNPPGGPSELVVRTLADRLSTALGQTVIVENRPGGANGSVGARYVAGAEPDGYTLLFTQPGPLVVAPAIYRDIGYDPVKSFAPIASILASPQMLVVNPTLPVRTMAELVAHAKAHPHQISYASPGYGSQPHLLGEMFRLATGIDVVHVPYRTPPQAITDLMSGEVQMEFETIAILLPHIQSGKLKALAIADATRNPALPDLPTTGESGFPQLQATFWSGVLAPAGTPPEIVGKLNGAINAILGSKDLEASLAALSARPKIGTPQDFASFIAAEAQKWTSVAVAANIKAE